MFYKRAKNLPIKQNRAKTNTRRALQQPDLEIFKVMFANDKFMENFFKQSKLDGRTDGRTQTRQRYKFQCVHNISNSMIIAVYYLINK